MSDVLKTAIKNLSNTNKPVTDDILDLSGVLDTKPKDLKSFLK